MKEGKEGKEVPGEVFSRLRWWLLCGMISPYLPEGVNDPTLKG